MNLQSLIVLADDAIKITNYDGPYRFVLTADVPNMGVTAAANRAEAAATAAEIDATNAHADALAAEAAAAIAAGASLVNDVYVTAYASTLPKGVTGTTSLVAGSGGANGTFALGFTGGSITGMAGTFTVAGGALTSISITNPGLGTGSTPPTLVFTASSGLSGASATAVVGSVIAAQHTYWVLAADGTYYQLYRNDGTSTPAIVAGAIFRIDDGLYLMLALAGDGVDFTGVAVPPLPASPQNGLQIVATFPVVTLAGANIEGLPLSLMDGTLAFDGMVDAGVPTEFVLIDGKLRLRGGGEMEGPVSWFNGSGTFDTTSQELLPDAPNLVDWYIEPLPSGGTVLLGPGGIKPSATTEGTLTIPPTGFRASDRKFATPFNLVASAPNTKVSFWFSTRDGINPVADKKFDELLARNGTILSGGWDAPLRAHFTRCFPQIQKSKYFNPWLGPDDTFALENWAQNTQDILHNTPARNSKNGYAFTGNGGAKYIDLGVTEADLDPDDITVGIATIDTVASVNGAAMAISNQVCALENMRTGNVMALHASTPSTDTVSPSVMGGLVLWSRVASTGFIAYSDTQSFPVTRTGTSTTAFNFLVGCDVAPTVGGPKTNSYHTGNLDHGIVSRAWSASDKANVRASRITLFAEIAGL